MTAHLREQWRTAADHDYSPEHQVIQFAGLPSLSAGEAKSLASEWVGEAVEVMDWSPSFKTQLDTAGAAAAWIRTKSGMVAPAILVKKWNWLDKLMVAHECAHLIRNRDMILTEGNGIGGSHGHDSEWASIYVGLVASFSRGLADELREALA